MRLEFRPVNLDRHADLCVSVAEDMELCSFGSAMQLHGEDGLGAERYIQRMRDKLSADPESCLHVWQDDEIVGQLNLGRFIDPSIGYIHVFYVAPAWRGKGVANEMEEFAARWFVVRGLASARLSVSPTNARAMRFYVRRGWRDFGPRADKPTLHNMEKMFE
jgi:ribosomal protein S18 acetylase RimI-like enzyme